MPRNWVTFAPNSLPVIMARLGNHLFPVLVDTGAARSLIVPAVASGLGLRIVGTERIVGVTGAVASVQLVEVAGVGIGTIDLPSFYAGVLVGPPAPWGSGSARRQCFCWLAAAPRFYRGAIVSAVVNCWRSSRCRGATCPAVPHPSRSPIILEILHGQILCPARSNVTI